MRQAGRRPDRPHRSAGPTPVPDNGRPGRDPAESHALAEALQEGAQRLGRTLTAAQADRLLAYLALLSKWNGVYNLTAIREPHRMVSAHLLDSLAAQRELDGLAVRGPIGSGQTGHRGSIEVLDVGSGAGLPGLVWALMDLPAENASSSVVSAVEQPIPGLRDPASIDAVAPRRYTLIDAIEKKTAFQRQAAGELGLRAVSCVHGRVEQWKGGPFHVVASRAYATLAQFVAQTEHLLAEDGCWFAMKGAVPHDEIAALPSDITVDRVATLDVPGLGGAARCVVCLRRR